MFLTRFTSFLTRLLKNAPLTVVLVMALSPAVQAMVEHVNYKENKLNFLITADQFILAWKALGNFGYDFEVSTTSGLEYCGTGQCSQNLVDQGAQFYKVHDVPGKGKHVAYYDADGNLLGIGLYISKSDIGLLKRCTIDICGASNIANGADYYRYFDLDSGQTMIAFYDFEGNLVNSQDTQQPSNPPNQDSESLESQPMPTSLAGSFDGDHLVTSSGGSSYRIPVQVPRGVNGFEPKLAFVYNSQAKNDWLGQGWNMSGISTIQRCPQILAIDGKRVGISYTDSDRLCLDGQRLVNVSGEYWQSGTTYHTELDNLSRVTQIGSQGDVKFVIKTKSGLTLNYYRSFKPLNPVDLNQTIGQPYAWVISSMQDEFGNKIKFFYDSGSHEIVLKEIAYDDYKIVFNSSSRQDSTLQYRSGRAFKRTKALTSVVSYHAESPVLKYRMGYGSNPYSNDTGHLNLKFIQKCGYESGQQKCLKEMAFDQVNANSSLSSSPVDISDRPALTYDAFTFDYNGDGLQDILTYGLSADGSGETDFFLSRNANGSFVKSLYLKALGWAAAPIDDEGNGRQKLAYLKVNRTTDNFGNTETYYRWYVNYTPLGAEWSRDETEAAPESGYITSPRPIAYDVNQDGLQDLIAKEKDVWKLFLAPFISGKNGVELATEPGSIIPLGVSKGSPEFLLYDAESSSQKLKKYNVEDNTFYSSGSVSISKQKRILALDVNGDGLQDIAHPDGLLMNTGGSDFVSVSLNLSAALPNYVGRLQAHQYPTRVIDYNGDGYSDILYLPNIGSTYRVLISNRKDGFLPSKDTGVSNNTSINYGQITPGSAGSPPRTVPPAYQDQLYCSHSTYPHVPNSLRQVYYDNRGSTANDGAGCNYSTVERGVCGIRNSFYSPDNQYSSTRSQPLSTYSAVLDGMTEANQESKARELAATIDRLEPGISKPRRFFIAINVRSYYWVESGCRVQRTAFPPVTIPGTPSEPDVVINGKGIEDLLILDANNDGQQDLVQLGNSSTKWGAYYQSRNTQPDLLEKITTSLGQEIKFQYKSGLNPAVYEGNDGGSFPVRNYATSRSLVEKVVFDDGSYSLRGIKQKSEIAYKYKGSKMHLQGRGYLGFSQIKTTDSRDRIQRTSLFHQQFPYIGRTVSAESKANNGEGNIISSVNNIWSIKSHYADKVKFPYLQQIKNNNFELDGNLAGQSIVENQFTNEGYGNLISTKTSVKSAVSGEVEKETLISHLYQGEDCNQNSSAWFIGFKCKTTEQHSIGSISKSIVTQYKPWQTTHSPKQVLSYLGDAGLENVQNIIYDTYGNVKTIDAGSAPTVIDPNKTVVPRTVETNSYQSKRFLNQTINAKGHVVKSYYDEKFGLPSNQADENGIKTYFSYDALGRQSQRLDASTGSSLITEYKSCIESTCSVNHAVYSVITSSINSSINGSIAPKETIYFDILNRPIRKETIGFDGNSIYVDTTYDERGNIKTVSEPYYAGQTAYKTEHTKIDILGRVTELKQPDGGKVVTNYAGNAEGGRTITKTITVKGMNADGSAKPDTQQVIVRKENALGQLDNIIDALGTKTEYDYDPLGNLVYTRVDNNDATVVTSVFDNAGNKIEMKDPDTGRYQYVYDVLGNLRKQIDAKNQTVEIQYDALDRMIRRTDKNSSGVIEGASSWIYDTADNGIGLLHCNADKVIDNCTESATYKELYTYDGSSRIVKNTTEINLPNKNKTYAMDYSYDDSGRIQLTTYPSGIKVKNHYNNHGYLSKHTDENDRAVYREINAMTPRAQVSQATFYNNQVTQWGHRPENGRISNINTAKGDNVVQKLSYHFDTQGNLNWRKDSRSTERYESFNYDVLNRLVSTQIDSQPVQSYTYSKLGNILTKPGIRGSFEYFDGTETESGSGGIHAVKHARGFNYRYDDNGNMLTVKNGSNYLIRKMNYSTFNKPIRIENNNVVTTFTYSPDRNRYYQKNISNGTTTETFYVMGGAFEEIIEGDVSKQRSYVDDYLIHTHQPGSTTTFFESLKYIHRDHLGSVDVITNADGSVAQRMSFAAFGGRRDSADWDGSATVDTSNTTRGYTDHEHLDAVGLIHMNGRVYDPVIGRFLSPDIVIQFPEFSQSYNRYSYVLNNPLSFNDPTGYETATIVNGQYIVQDDPWHDFWLAAPLVMLGDAFPVTDSFGNENINLLTGYQIDAGQKLDARIGVAGFLIPGSKEAGAFHPWLNKLSLGIKSGAGVIRNIISTALDNRIAHQTAEYVLQQLEIQAGRNAHFFSRHGAQTTLDQQFIRSTTGMTPDGVQQRFLVDSTRFLTHEAQLASYDMAIAQYQIHGRRVFNFTMNEIVGEGYFANGATYGTSDVVRVIIDSRTGAPNTMFPLLGK